MYYICSVSLYVCDSFPVKHMEYNTEALLRCDYLSKHEVIEYC